MTEPLRPLYLDEYNRLDQALMLTWMFRGVEERVQVPMPFVRNVANSQRLLVPASALGIPDRLVDAAYVEAAEQLCFTVPGYPRTVFSQRIIDPLYQPDAHDALRSMIALAHPSNPPSLPNTEMDADVVTLCASSDSLFVLTRERGRIAETSALRLHRLMPDAYLGVRTVNSRDEWPLSFPDGGVPMGPLRIAVSAVPDQETLFLATRDGTAYTASLDAREPAMDAMNAGVWPAGAGVLPALHAPGMGTALGTRIALVVSDGASGDLYALRREEGALAVEPLPEEGNRLPRVSAVDSWTYNVHEHVPEALPEDLLVSMLVAASPADRRLWTVSLDERRTPLPLIGGGKNPFYSGTVPANLLEIDIGPVDRVVVVPHAGILFGTAGGGDTGWLFLLSPRMLSLLDPAVTAQPPASTRSSEKRYS